MRPLDDPVLWPLATSLFPDARIVVVPDYRVLPDFGQIDAAVWSLEQAAALARSTPGITAVVPKDLGNPFLLTYLMPPGSDEMVHFVNYRLDMRKVDGMHERERNYWIRGQPSATPPPRWSGARNVLHWVK
jgi:proton glutamate symport protein